MRIVVTTDEGSEIVYQHVTDYYLALRQMEPCKVGEDSRVSLLPETRSYSRGSNLREVVKELAQSLVEIQAYLKTITPIPIVNRESLNGVNP